MRTGFRQAPYRLRARQASAGSRLGGGRRIDHGPEFDEGYAVRAVEERARREAEREGREYVPVTDRRRVNELRRRINWRLRRIMDEIREIVLSRLERAKSEKTKRAAQRKTAHRRRARRKRTYAPARGRHVSPSGGLSK